MTAILPNSKAFYLMCAFFLICNIVSAQKKLAKFALESQTIGTTNGTVPFWMRSNQFGSVPLSGLSQSFIGRAYKEFSPIPSKDSTNQNRKLLDWGFGFEGRANLGKGTNLQLIEAYAKVRIGLFNVTAGRNKNVMGLNGDTTLSAGNFAVSGNAPGVPRIEISIPDYYSIPVLNELLSIKGNILHGWLGRMNIRNPVNSRNYYQNTFFHQKSLYLRIGKPNWKFKMHGGFNHHAYWGSEKEIFGPAFKLSEFETFKYVFLGKVYEESGYYTSKIGNQLGSLDIGAEYSFENFNVMVYRQNFYDVGALSKLANIKDGLTGITLTNKNFNKTSGIFKWKKLLVELFYSKDQAGYPWSKPTKSGDEDYYNNFYYKQGWSYMNKALGNPLITTRNDIKSGQEIRNEYFVNNRVVAFHLGMEGAIKDWEVLTKLTYSNNYGTFATSEYGHSLGEFIEENRGGVFDKANQLSFYFEGMKPFKNGINGGLAASFDQGELLYESFGMILKLRKAF